MGQAEQKSLRYERKIDYLQGQIAQLQRMLFGQKRERFEGDPSQGVLPFEASEQQQREQQACHQETITYVRTKQPRQNHTGREPLPDHLPVEEIEIYPQGDLSGMVCIGREVTEELELEPARFYIKRYIRYKYTPKTKDSGGGVLIGSLPERVIDKGIAGAGLLASILVDKYVDHLPLYRQRQRFLRENIPIARTVLFDYQPTRRGSAAKEILDDFKGYLQTDGYSGYKKIGARPGVTHLGCWAHARRYFEKALDNDSQRAGQGLLYIQGLYEVERKARQGNLSPQDRKKLRLEKSLPLINQMGKWIHAQAKQVLPKSPIGIAFSYSAQRWDALSGYLYDGSLEIDNNLVENAIRPVALGRKNYLFAGSHEGARRAAMAYSFFATCKAHQVNPHQWLKHVLENIMSTKYNNVRDLYPQNFKTNM